MREFVIFQISKSLFNGQEIQNYQSSDAPEILRSVITAK